LFQGDKRRLIFLRSKSKANRDQAYHPSYWSSMAGIGQ
jgi:hypothetical protein